jgi:hypothetical protein
VIDIVVIVVDYDSCISNLNLICIGFGKVFIKVFYEFQCSFAIPYISFIVLYWFLISTIYLELSICFEFNVGRLYIPRG